jgi:hypothetical protein
VKVKEVIKHSSKVSEPVRGFPSTGHMFAIADSTLTAISAQYSPHTVEPRDWK